MIKTALLIISTLFFSTQTLAINGAKLCQLEDTILNTLSGFDSYVETTQILENDYADWIEATQSAIENKQLNENGQLVEIGNLLQEKLNPKITSLINELNNYQGECKESIKNFIEIEFANFKLYHESVIHELTLKLDETKTVTTKANFDTNN